MHPEWQTLVWESIHQNGNACDYLSEKVIQDSIIRDGYLQYNKRKYHTIFLTQVESMEPATAKKLYEWVQSGGKVFFIEAYPSKAPGWKDHEQRDKEVQDWIEKMKTYEYRCFLLTKPGKNYTAWFKNIQEEHKLRPYIDIDSPDKFVTQVRYQAKGVEILLVINSNMHDSYEVTIKPSPEILSGKQAWIWDAEDGERYKLTKPAAITLDMGPADLKLLVFDKEKKGVFYEPVKPLDQEAVILTSQWSVTGNHIDGRTIAKEITELKDLKEIDAWVDFCGNITYKTNLVVTAGKKIKWLNLGKVFGVSELWVNGESAGIRWYGRRIYNIERLVKEGKNNIEVIVTTTMGNYLKSLKDNRVAQYWTNEGRTIQPLQSMGIAGPVTIY
jgi:hypothetical protein